VKTLRIKIKTLKAALYAWVVLCCFLIIMLIFIPLLYHDSLSSSPLNIWRGEEGLKRLERIAKMGLAGAAEDLWGEIRFKFRRCFAYFERLAGKEGKIYAKVDKSGFMIFQEENGEWKRIFVKGVNMGTALPGKWFTNFPADEGVYFDWLEKIGQMQANCVRVYTLLPPEFYRALLYYNIKHPDAPLWLFQEIWPEEHPERGDYLRQKYVEEYFQEIRYAVDAVHGRANIPERKGRAYGTYDSDVSRYVLGYLVGRELEPEEVIATNQNNPGFSYRGEYLSSAEGASPAEGWLAMNCDYVLQYEESRYGTQHPVAIVSWPTLDVPEHDSEWNALGMKSLEYNDKVAVDINRIATGERLQAGFFGAYHIYPNYPDFMNNESKYGAYYDEEGRFRYGGYLKEFMEYHVKYPALVAEFGLATGMGNAHWNPDGYHHGGMTEEEQGKGIVRMLRAIRREGYAGGLIFEWMDEWAKKTWTTEPFMIPYERHVLWHNAIDPEQNYGIYAIEPVKSEEDYVQNGSGAIKRVALSCDASFLYLDIELSRPADFEREKILIGFDTYDRTRGEFRFSPELDVRAPWGLEFLADLSGLENARLLANPGYNIGKGRYSSLTASAGEFEEVKMLINKERVTKDGRKIEAVYHDLSKLCYGDFADNTHNHWYIEGNTVHLRLPWGSLNVSDPSSHRVLDDPRQFLVSERDVLRTAETDGIFASVLLVDRERQAIADMLSLKRPFLWEGWEEPMYRMRPKKSYEIIREFFAML